tara:strand:- start:33 stop:314 length:282 start_codon:yes stop_codon:yes gene_type:complete
MEFTEQQIKNIIEDHKNRLAKDRLKYEQIKDTEDFRLKIVSDQKNIIRTIRTRRHYFIWRIKNFLKPGIHIIIIRREIKWIFSLINFPIGMNL